MSLNIKTAYDQLPQFLKLAIDEQIQKATEEEIIKASENIKKRSTEIIAGVLLNVQKQVLFNRIGEELRISIKLHNE